MNQAEFYNELVAIGLPVANERFHNSEDHPAPEPPFIIYSFSFSGDLMADNHNFLDISNFQVELYTDFKEPSLEKKVKDKLKEMRLPYTATGTFIEDEKMYQMVYEIQLIGE